MAQRFKSVVVLLLLFQVVIRGVLIFHAGPMTDQDYYGDDSFMSHKFAQNIAEGKGITQAGTVNNGFQPLFVFLMVPFFWFFDPLQATIASAVMNSFFSIAGSWFMFLLVRRLTNERAGVIALALWSFSPHLTRIGLNGLETSLANMLAIVVLLVHLKSVDTLTKWSHARSAGLGLLMGLSLLARLDVGLLLLPLGIHQIIVRIRHWQHPQLFTLLVVAALTIAPWFLWSQVACGSWIPHSGEATRTVSQLYGSPTGPTRVANYFPLGEVPSSYYTNNLVHAAKHLINNAPLNLPVATVMGEHSPAAIIWLVVLIGLGALSMGDNRKQALCDVTRIWYAWVFCGLLVAVYCFYYFAQWHFWRYLSPVTILLLIPSAICVNAITAKSLIASRVGKSVSVIIVLAGLACSIIGHSNLVQSREAHGIAYNLYHDAINLNEFFEPSARIGSFESGTLDYFSGRVIYNLDGKTNVYALEALKQKSMHELVDELQLDYVISSPPLIRDLLIARGNWRRGTLERIKPTNADGTPVFAHNWVFKINRTHAIRPN